jgi:hypothetical protein
MVPGCLDLQYPFLALWACSDLHGGPQMGLELGSSLTTGVSTHV